MFVYVMVGDNSNGVVHRLLRGCNGLGRQLHLNICNSTGCTYVLLCVYNVYTCMTIGFGVLLTGVVCGIEITFVAVCTTAVIREWSIRI